jgi:hypothetical protein
MPRIPKRTAATANPDIQSLGLGMPGGALNIPATRKPTRGALGGTTPRGARMKLPPTVAPAGRGGKKRAAPKRKAAR